MVEGEVLDALERELELLGADEFELQTEEQQQVLIWRVVQFSRLGFDAATCVALADSPADLGQARRLIAARCGRELVSRILL